MTIRLRALFIFAIGVIFSAYSNAQSPGQVSNLQIPNPITNASFSLIWNGPTSGGTVERYELQKIGQGDTAWQSLSSSLTSTNFNHSDPLSTGSYAFQVRACNSTGCGPFLASGFIQAAGPVLSGGEVNCSSNGYCVKLRGSNINRSSTYVDVRRLDLSGLATIFQGSGLSRGSDGLGDYLQLSVPSQLQAEFASEGLKFYAVNYDQLMFSPPVVLQKAAASQLAPGQVLNFQIPSPIANAAFAMTWSAPSSGGAVERYELERIGQNQSGWTTLATNLSTTNYSHNDSLMTDSYAFRIRACNTIGCSAFTTSGYILATGPLLLSGEVNCASDGYCVKLRGSNISRPSTYVDIRRLDGTGLVTIFQGSGLTRADDAVGAYLQLTVPTQLQAAFGSEGLKFYAVNFDQLMFSPPLILNKISEIPGVAISANPAVGLTAPASTTLSSTLANIANVSSVSYSAGGTAITCVGGVGPAPTYNCAWQNIAAGTYSVIARATANGQNYDSSPLAITVAVGSTPSITVNANPASGLIAPASTTLSATLVNLANVTSVSYFNGANQIACPTTPAPPSYSCFWQGIAAATHSVTARAAVTGGSTVISQPIVLVVANPNSGVAATPPSPVLAQPPSAAEIAASDKVGASSGEFRVDEQGNATFAMPIVSMPGIAGTSPKMSIAYNSGTGEGPLGLGFRIGGQSAIYRCRKTPEIDGIISGAYPPITFTDTDSYCLDGQRLILIGAQPGSTTRFEFKTELDSYQRIVAVDEKVDISGFDTFFVYGKDGNISQYGSDAGAFGLSGSAGRLFANDGVAIRVPNVVQEWALTELKDRSNNTIYFSYLTDHSIGQQLLQEVGYNGGNPTFGPNSFIRFTYNETGVKGAKAARANVSYIAGSKVVAKRFLTAVQSGPRTYNFAYAPETDSGGARRLNTITECASGICLKPTVFNWTDEGFLYGLNRFSEKVVDLTSSYEQWKFVRLADIDGDGRKELLTFIDLGNILYLHAMRIVVDPADASKLTLDIAGTINTGINIPDANPWYSENVLQVLDINGDGRDDVMVADAASQKWVLYTSSGTFTANGLFTRRPVEFELPLGTIQSSGNRVTDSQLADFNGDGLADFVTYTSEQISGGGVQYKYQIYPMERTAFLTAQQQGMPYKFGAVRTWRPNICGTFSFHGAAKKPSFEPIDFNNDGFSDLRLTYENGQACTAGNNQVVILPSNPMHPDLVQYRTLNTAAVVKRDYFFTSNGMNATEALFTILPNPFEAIIDGETRRVVDINGDGTSDLISVFAKAPKRVVYALGTGVGFAYDVLVNTISVPISEDASFELTDLNQDGALEVVYPYNPAVANTEKAAAGSPQSCAPGEIREFRVLSWSGDTFLPGNSLAFGAPKFCDREYVRLFSDLDGDGNLDALYMGDEEAQDSRGEAVLYRGATRFKPAHRVERLTDGLGAIQVIKYSPMTYSTLYQRDFSAPYFRSDFALGAAGRGSALFDVSSTSYLVQYTWTSAPTASDPVVNPSTLSGMTGIQYFYEGAKAQAGGRGALGFRAVNTLDLQTWIRSRTEYEQKFPLVSVPKSTTMWQLDTAVMANDACNGAALGDAHACMVPTPVCSGGVSSQCVRFSTGALISENIDAWSARPVQFSLQTIAGGQYYTPSTASAAGVQSWQVRRATSNAKNYEFGTLTFSQTTAYTNYDDYGNVGNTTLQTFPSGVATPIKSISTVQAYDNLLASWMLGRLRSSTVTTTRGTESTTRISEFEYSASTGQLSMEKVSPQGLSGDALRRQTIASYYQYDSYGNLTLKASCSNEFTRATCLENQATYSDAYGAVIVPNLVPYSSSDQLSVRRYEATVFDSLGLYPDRTYSPFYDSASSAGFGGVNAAPRLSGRIESRDFYGQPTSSYDANGVHMRSAYGAFGRKYFDATDSGSGFKSSYGWCNLAEQTTAVKVRCPNAGASTAVFWMRSEAAGAPKAWTFMDQLGREVLTVQEGLLSTQYSATAKSYDRLSRVEKLSEPYFTQNPECGEVSANCSAGGVGTAILGTSIYWTKTHYDSLGRVKQIDYPEGNSSFTTFAALTTTLENQKRQLKIVETNALGETIRVTDDADGAPPDVGRVNSTICSIYDNFGQIKQTYRPDANTPTDCAAAANRVVLQSIFYDQMGRKSSMTDADMGGWSYRYNAMGEQLEEINARNQCIAVRYDVRGRALERADYLNATCNGTPQQSSSFVFDTLKLGLLSEEKTTENGIEVFKRSPSYDDFSRLQAVRTDMRDGTEVLDPMVAETTYDQFGRVFQSFEARRVGTAKTYGVLMQYSVAGFDAENGITTHAGFAFRMREAIPGLSGQIYSQSLDMDARGNVTQERKGNNVGLETKRTFDLDTGRLRTIRTGQLIGTSYALQDLGYGYDTLDNLTLRQDKRRNISETFDYDRLNRLEAVTPLGKSIPAASYSYDRGGNFISKAGITHRYGSYTAAGSCSSTLGPHALAQAGTKRYCYDAEGNQTAAYRQSDNALLREISFSVAGLVTSTRVTEPQGRTSQFAYGPDRARFLRRDYESASAVGAYKRTLYLGGTEIIRTLAGVTETKRYIGGIVINTRRSNGVNSTEYIFTDHLGSTDVITDGQGVVQQAQSFGAFGERRSDTWVGLSVIAQQSFDTSRTTRGYTGHEQIDGTGLIHMNARLYDPETGRFISADTVIENASASQAFNRYSYVMNNPMSYTDPTGHYMSRAQRNVRAVAAIAVAIVSGGAALGWFGAVSSTTAWTAVIAGGAISGAVTSGKLEGTLIGALEAATFFKIGALASAGKLTGGKLVLAHSIAGGTFTALQGGNFGHGFISAGIGKFVDIKLDAGGASLPTRAISAVIVGGTVSEITGGKFANGAATGAFQFVLNAAQGVANEAAQKRYAANRLKITAALADLRTQALGDTIEFAERADFGYGTWNDSGRPDPDANNALPDMTRPPGTPKGGSSSAFGKYQFMTDTWNKVQSVHIGSLPDIMPSAQDMAFGALVAVDYNGRIYNALKADNINLALDHSMQQWAAISSADKPLGNYGQAHYSRAALVDFYNNALSNRMQESK